jgi:hypothetical protein
MFFFVVNYESVMDYSTGLCGLTRKHYTRLERLARDKHSSLLRKSVNYISKKFYSTGQKAEYSIFGKKLGYKMMRAAEN